MSILSKPKLYLSIFFKLSFLAPILPQAVTSDSDFYRTAVSQVILFYTGSLKEGLGLYNGHEFTGGYRSSAGFPFFEYQDPTPGDIMYEGIYYPSVLLSYDLVNDQVIFITPGKNLNIELSPDKVSWFSIKNHLFVNLRGEDGDDQFPGTGFYQLLYEGDGTVLAKSKKRLYQPSQTDEIARFLQSDVYYVRKKNAWYLINSRRALLAVCKDYKPEIIKYIQQEKLSFKKDPAQMILKVMEFYTKRKL